MATWTDEVAADSPIAWWRLGDAGGVTAVAAVGPNGTYVNTPTLGVAGLVDGDTAVRFDRASAEYMDVPTSMPAGSSVGISVEFGLSITNDPGFDQSLRLFSWGAIATTPHHLLVLRHFDAATWMWTWYFSDGTARSLNATSSGPLIPTNGTPHHVVVTHDYAAKMILIYVGGALQKSVNASAFGVPAAITAGVAARWAAYMGNTLSTHGGMMDEGLVYGSVLSAGRVAAHWNAIRRGGNMARRALQAVNRASSF